MKCAQVSVGSTLWRFPPPQRILHVWVHARIIQHELRAVRLQDLCGIEQQLSQLNKHTVAEDCVAHKQMTCAEHGCMMWSTVLLSGWMRMSRLPEVPSSRIILQSAERKQL